NDVVQNLRQQIYEIGNDDRTIDPVLHDVRQKLEQRDEDEQGDEDDQDQYEKKPEPAQNVDVQQPEEFRMVRQRVGPSAETLAASSKAAGQIGERSHDRSER